MLTGWDRPHLASSAPGLVGSPAASPGHHFGGGWRVVGGGWSRPSHRAHHHLGVEASGLHLARKPHRGGGGSLDPKLQDPRCRGWG